MYVWQWAAAYCFLGALELLDTLFPTESWRMGEGGAFMICVRIFLSGWHQSVWELFVWKSCISLVAQLVKNLPAMQETWLDSWVRKIPWKGNGNPFQCSCLENSMDRWAWWAKSHPRLSTREKREKYLRIWLTSLGL